MGDLAPRPPVPWWRLGRLGEPAGAVPAPAWSRSGVFRIDLTLDPGNAREAVLLAVCRDAGSVGCDMRGLPRRAMLRGLEGMAAAGALPHAVLEAVPHLADIWDRMAGSSAATARAAGVGGVSGMPPLAGTPVGRTVARLDAGPFPDDAHPAVAPVAVTPTGHRGGSPRGTARGAPAGIAGPTPTSPGTCGGKGPFDHVPAYLYGDAPVVAVATEPPSPGTGNQGDPVDFLSTFLSELAEGHPSVPDARPDARRGPSMADRGMRVHPVEAVDGDRADGRHGPIGDAWRGTGHAHGRDRACTDAREPGMPVRTPRHGARRVQVGASVGGFELSTVPEVVRHLALADGRREHDGEDDAIFRMLSDLDDGPGRLPSREDPDDDAVFGALTDPEDGRDASAVRGDAAGVPRSCGGQAARTCPESPGDLAPGPDDGDKVYAVAAPFAHAPTLGAPSCRPGRPEDARRGLDDETPGHVPPRPATPLQGAPPAAGAGIHVQAVASASWKAPAPLAWPMPRPLGRPALDPL